MPVVFVLLSTEVYDRCIRYQQQSVVLVYVLSLSYCCTVLLDCLCTVLLLLLYPTIMHTVVMLRCTTKKHAVQTRHSSSATPVVMKAPNRRSCERASLRKLSIYHGSLSFCSCSIGRYSATMATSGRSRGATRGLRDGEGGGEGVAHLIPREFHVVSGVLVGLYRARPDATVQSTWSGNLYGGG